MTRELFSLFMVILMGEVVSDKIIDELSAASTSFSQSLYQQVALDKDNVVFSPLSIHLALTMAMSGTRRSTNHEMGTTLKFRLFDHSHTHRYYGEIMKQLKSVPDVKVYIGNALFIKPNLLIGPDFDRRGRIYYSSMESKFNQNATLGPENIINKYVNEKTHFMIPEILLPGTINASTTALTIINTLFFSGTWTMHLEKYFYNQDFYKPGGVKTQIDMMTATRQFNLKKDEKLGIDIVEIPFKNKRFGMYIVLPRERDGIKKLEGLLQSPGIVDGFFNGLKSTEVHLSIPQFQIETSLSLKKILQNMGMANAFIENKAKFIWSIRGAKDVHLNEVLHKAFIEFKETSTVAAAATGVVYGSRSRRQSPRYAVRADHPFLFFLRDNDTKQILLLGKYSGRDRT